MTIHSRMNESMSAVLIAHYNTRSILKQQLQTFVLQSVLGIVHVRREWDSERAQYEMNKRR